MALSSLGGRGWLQDFKGKSHEFSEEKKKEKGKGKGLIFLPISCMPSVGQMRMIEVPLQTTRPKSRISSKIFWWSSPSGGKIEDQFSMKKEKEKEKD